MKEIKQGFIVWLFGLSGAGKTTIAIELQHQLNEMGIHTQKLDGDVVRKHLTKDLGFSIEDRFENIRRNAFVANLLSKNGVNVIASFVTPLIAMRKFLEMNLGDNLHLFCVNTSLDYCIERDVKGLYKMALNGEIESFTGITSPFEWGYSQNVPTYNMSPKESAEFIVNKLKRKKVIG